MFCNNSENVTRANVHGKKNRKRKKHSSYPQCDKKAKQTDQSNSNLNTAMSNWGKCQHVAESWQIKHEIAFWKSRAKGLEYENKVLHDTIKNLYFEHFAQPTTSADESAKLFNLVTNDLEHETGIEEDDNDEDSDEEYDEDDNNDDDNFEVSDEFIEFLKQNAKYKEDAMKEKEQLKAKLEAENKELLMEDENLESSEVKRDRYMKLYGADWEKIMALETSFLCHFINECDKERPKYWPNIPLNFDCC